METTEICYQTQYYPHPVVIIQKSLNGHDLGPSIHSSFGNHNISEAYDFVNLNTQHAPEVWYFVGGENTLTFTNISPVTVYLKNIRLIRAYGMKSLDYDVTYEGQPEACSGPIDTGSSGIDYTRRDYPCNYQNYGDRYSFTHFYESHTVGNNPPIGTPIVIQPNQFYSWTFTNPTQTFEHPNYVGKGVCYFNFNNVQLENNSNGIDAHYSVHVNGQKVVDYYHGKQANLGQYATIDLAKFACYNDLPGATNTVELHNDSDVNMKLLDLNSGTIDIYRFYKVTNLCQDNFTNVTDRTDKSSAIWSTLTAGSGTQSVTEPNDQLQVQISNTSGWSQAGYVTHFSYDTRQQYDLNQEGFETSIDVTNIGSLKEMNFLISTEKTTSQDPTTLSNWYRISKNAADSTVKVQNRLNAGMVSTKLQTSWASSTGQLKIKVSTGSIALYENGNLRYAEPFAFLLNKCYIYIYTNSNQNGTGTFDNFKIIPAQIFRTEFINSDINGWETDSGNWSAQSGKLQSSTSNAHIHNSSEFAKNRHVRADIQSLSNRGSRNVAWLMAKEVDGNNLVCGLIRTGYVELGIFYGGQQYWYQGDSTLDPTAVHSMAISIIGDTAKIWVDGTLYREVTDSMLNAAVFDGGYIGLYTPGCTGAFDFVAVLNSNSYYTINATAGSGGSISPSGAIQVPQNTSKTFTIAPQSGHRSQVYVDGVDHGAVYSYTFSNVTANHTISAQFIQTYSITASAGEGGSISPNGYATADLGSTPSYTITAYDCYQIASITIDGGTPLTPGGAQYVYTFDPIQNNHTIAATFSLGSPTHKPVSVSAAIDNNVTFTIDGNNYSVITGESANLCLSVSDHHIFQAPQSVLSLYVQSYIPLYRWNIFSNNQYVGSQYCNPMAYAPSDQTSIQAEYNPSGASTYSLSVSSSAGGTIAPNGTVTVCSGGNATFYIAPESGYHLADLLVNGVSVKSSVSNNQYTLSNVSSNTTVYASFSTQYRLTTGVGSGSGSVSPSTQDYNYGATVTLSATPSTGYRFDHWLVGSSTYTTATTNITITDDVTATAYFVRRYTLTTVVSGFGGTTTPASSTVDAGSTVWIDATPDSNYSFTHWSIGGVTNYNAHTSVVVNSDVTCTAYFATNQFQLTMSADPSAGGSPTPVSQTFGYGTPVTLYPNPSSNYTFNRWTIDGADNYTVNPQIIMNQAHTVVCHYVLQSYTVGFGYSDVWGIDMGNCPIIIDGNSGYIATYNTYNTYTLTAGQHTVEFPPSAYYFHVTAIYQDGSTQISSTYTATFTVGGNTNIEASYTVL
jgi:hypothetical protein